MSLTTTLTVGLSATLLQQLDLSQPKDALSYAFPGSLTTGTADAQADILWHDARSLSPNSSDTLDLAGSLVDGLGVTVNLARIKLIIIENTSTVAGDVLLVGGAASNAWEGWTTVAGSKIKVGPKGIVQLYNPSAAAYAVTAGTGDQLKIANSNNSTSASALTYKIIIIGASA